MGRGRALRRVLVAAGLLLSAWMALRAQVGGDQLNLLARGWLWAARGELVPYGNPLSSGGNGPGALTTVVVGAPLFVWMDHRAPVALTWLCHLAAFLLLDRLLARHLSAGERLAFVAVYWLNPWRLEPSAFLWNPNLLFLAGAVHLATAFGSRERASWALSALHVLTLGLAFQLHPGTLLLAALSALLWLRGYVRVHWGGVALGALAVGATLVPWLLAARADPAILAAAEGFPLRGLIYLFPLLKGMLYLLRYPSLALNGQTTRFDFTELLGAGADRWLTPAAKGLLGVAGAVTAVAAARGALEFLPRPPAARALGGARHGNRRAELARGLRGALLRRRPRGLRAGADHAPGLAGAADLPRGGAARGLRGGAARGGGSARRRRGGPCSATRRSRWRSTSRSPSPAPTSAAPAGARWSSPSPRTRRCSTSSASSAPAPGRSTARAPGGPTCCRGRAARPHHRVDDQHARLERPVPDRDPPCRAQPELLAESPGRRRAARPSSPGSAA